MVEYQPAPHFNDSDSFVYRVRDGSDTWVTQTVTITIAPMDDPPTLAVPNRLVLFADEPTKEIGTELLLIDDVDHPDGIPDATFELVIDSAPAGTLKDSNSDPVGATVTLDRLPLTFTPAANGEDALTVRIKDDTGEFSESVTIAVYSGATRMGFSLNRGWNAISFPSDPLPEARAALAAVTRDRLLFPVVGGRRLRRGSVTEAPLSAGQGFYVHLEAPIDFIDLPGTATAAPFPVTNGWNLIGPSSDGQTTLPNGTIAAFRFNERGRLVRTDALTIEKAVWLLLREEP